MTGKTLRELYPTLLRLHERFELDLCGEGGEYESLVLDSRVFRRTLVLTETIIDYDAEDESVGCLRVVSCETRAKAGGGGGGGPAGSRAVAKAAALPSLPPVCSSSSRLPPHCVLLPHLSFSADGLLCQTGLLLPMLGDSASTPHSPAQQLQGLLQRLSLALAQGGYDVKDAVFVHLYVSEMTDFEGINVEYGEWFGNNPPARSCIQVGCALQ